MKILKHLTYVLLLSTAFVACKKDKASSENPAATKFHGKWVGTFGFDEDVTGYFFSLNVEPGGVIQELNFSGVATGEGTWKIEGNTLKGNYKMKFSPFNEYSVVAIINQTTGKMEGSWGYDGNGTTGGKMLLEKK